MIQAVEYIFAQCAATYGAAWDRSLGQAPIADVKTAWMNAIEPFRNSKKRIVWALQNLPERVPNAIEFRNLCRQAPHADTTPALPEPKADPQRVAAELAKLGAARDRVQHPHGHKQWAHTLKARDDAGLPVGTFARRCYREALRAFD